MDAALELLPLLVAVVSGVIAWRAQVAAAQARTQVDLWLREEQRRHDLAQRAARYHEPLVRAAYDLQSRLYNLLCRNLLGAHYDGGDERSRRYVVDNTVYLLAQYCAWTEIARREVRFIDLGADEPTRALTALQDEIVSTLQDDRHGPLLRLFAGEQRALGESLVVGSAGSSDCIGYGAFLQRLREGAVDPLVLTLRDDVEVMARSPAAARERMVELQHRLIDLLALLDPRCVRFPAAKRTKVDAPAPAPHGR